jgi:VWFA-related protein
MNEFQPAAAVQTKSLSCRLAGLLAALAITSSFVVAQTTPTVAAPASPPAPASSPQPASPSQSQTLTTPPPSTAAPVNADADIAPPVLKVGVNEVDLVFTVTDKHGHFIKGLNLSDFGLLDNRMQPEAVLHFQQQTDLPLRVGIMLDTSSSIRERFQFEQQAAVQFLMQTLHRNDRAFVEGFDVQIDLTQPFTNNIDALDQGISKLRPGGGTALYDALYSTCHDQMLTLRENGAVRKALVLVSDGDDNYSHAYEGDAIKECQRSETIVYAISTNVSPSRDKGDEILGQIADATGGRAFYPMRIEDVANGFTAINEELRSQYLLEYTPANFKADGSFRTIYLQARNPAYKVRAHTGYFAPKASQ